MALILEVNGEVIQPLQLTLADVQQYTPYSITAHFQSDDRTVSTNFTGARLWDILQTAGLKPNASEKRRVMARAGDKFRCLLRWHEINPDVAEHQILVAYEQDGQPLSAKYGPLRLVVPGDDQGRRYLRGLARITVLDQTSEADESNE